MNSKTLPLIRKSNSTLNYARSKTNDFVFFVLRNKASTFENVNTFEDIFCVVHDSYADLLNKGINTFATTQAQRKPSSQNRPERISTAYGYNLPLQSTLWNTNEQTKEKNRNSDIKTSFNLKLFRDYLTFFEIHPNSSISYVDNKHTVHLVQTETEFLELWKFAKSCGIHNKGVLLLIDFTNNLDDDIINSNDKISTLNDPKSLNTDNANLPENFQLKESTIEVNNTNMQSSNKLFDRRDDYDTFTPVLNLSTSCPILTKENDDVNLETAIPSNINSQDFLDKTPPLWFERYMEQFKQDIIKQVSDQVMVNVKKNLNECPMKSPRHARFEEAIQSEHQVYSHKSKNNSQVKNLFIDQKRRYKVVAKNRKKKEKKLEEKLAYNSEDDNSKEKANKHDKKYTSKFVDNINSICMSNNVTTQNETVNNHDSMLPEFLDSQRSLKENLYESNMSDVIEGSEFRMNCSITEHQMLDKRNFISKTCCCGDEIENISITSDISNEDDVSTECNFEMIQKPSMEEEQHFFLKNKDKKFKVRSKFHFLPKILSTQHSSIRIDEDHFTADSNNIPTSSGNSDINIPSFSKSNDKESSEHDDVNAKIFKACPLNISNKCRDEDANELTRTICEKLLENSVYKEINTESECLTVNNLQTNVNDSHTSYMTTKSINTASSDSPVTTHSCQAQMDLNDLTQSFHSHTTSIANNGVYCIGETNTTTSHDYSKHCLSNSSKPTNSKDNRTCEQIQKDISNKDTDKKMLREKSNAKNGKQINDDTAANSMPGTAEPVHILPETLVTGAVHFASYAYGAAREAFVKIRSNSDNRSSRRRMARQ